MKEISSADNPLFKKWSKLLKSSGIEKEGLFLAHGHKIVPDYLVHHAAKIESVLGSTKMEFPHLLKNKHVSLAPALFKELDIFETRSPILVLKKPDFKEWDYSLPSANLELLVPVQDPSNLGALVRSAFAFGVQNIILLKESAHPFHPKCVRSSSGYVLDMNFKIGPSVRELPNLENLVALDMSGVPLHKFSWPQPCYLLVGEEGAGIPQNISKENVHRVQIPMNENCESLNAMVATSIALYDSTVKRNS